MTNEPLNHNVVLRRLKEEREKAQNLLPQYHWYFATFPLPHYDLCINEVYYGFLTPIVAEFRQTNKIKYLGLFPEGQLRTYINRGYISHKKPTRVVFHETVNMERRDSI